MAIEISIVKIIIICIMLAYRKIHLMVQATLLPSRKSQPEILRRTTKFYRNCDPNLMLVN
jgi:hypothetical protein